MRRLVGLSIVGLLSIVWASPLVAETETEDEQWARWNDPAIQKREPFRIFDNLYYVGLDWVSAFLLTTDEGHILIDALYGDLAEHALDGTRALGFDPADIRYVLPTHGHWDHAGGALHVKRRTGARVGMTEADWVLVETSPGEGRARFEPPPRDLVLADGDTLRLGDTEIRCRVTPGHTAGVLSLEFGVRDGAREHIAFLFGGVGRNFEGVERARQYLASVRRIRALQARDGFGVNLTNHPGMAGIFRRAELLAERGKADPHPFVDPGDFGEWLAKLEAAGRRKLEEEQRQGAAGASAGGAAPHEVQQQADGQGGRGR